MGFKEILHVMYFIFFISHFFTLSLCGKVDPVGEVSKIKLQVVLKLSDYVLSYNVSADGQRIFWLKYVQ